MLGEPQVAAAKSSEPAFALTPGDYSAQCLTLKSSGANYAYLGNTAASNISVLKACKTATTPRPSKAPAFMCRARLSRRQKKTSTTGST